MRAVRHLVCLAALTVPTTAAFGAVIAFDSNESYAAGSQLNGQNGGTGFTTPYTTASTNVTVVNQSLTYNNGSVSGSGGSRAVQVAGATDSNNLVVRGFPSQTGSPVYVSFLYRTDNTTEAFLQFGLSNTNVNEPISSVGLQGIAGSGGGDEGFFARTPNAGTTTFDTAGINANQTYLVVARISKGAGSSTYNVVDLFVNPNSTVEGTPTLTASAAAGTGVSSFNNFILRTARTDAGSNYLYDNLTIGTSYADVVPEPGAVGLFAAAAVAGLARRRRA